jgi:hypothetical protein
VSEWTIRVRAVDDRVPIEVRVRALLKSTLRRHGLVAVDVRRAEQEPKREGR